MLSGASGCVFQLPTRAWEDLLRRISTAAGAGLSGYACCQMRATSVGASVLRVSGDGNCLARAFSMVLFNNDEHQVNLRFLYTGFVLAEPSLQAFIDGFNHRAYFATNVVPGLNWGGHVELIALARASLLTVFLLTDQADCPYIEVGRFGTAACVLAYHGRNHYDVVGYPQGRAAAVLPSIILSLPTINRIRQMEAMEGLFRNRAQTTCEEALDRIILEHMLWASERAARSKKRARDLDGVFFDVVGGNSEDDQYYFAADEDVGENDEDG